MCLKAQVRVHVPQNLITSCEILVIEALSLPQVRLADVHRVVTHHLH